MRTSCEKCDLDPDGRCQECIGLISGFMAGISKLQDKFKEIIRVAKSEMEETMKVLTERFKTEPHQCEECLRSNGDYAMARLIRQLSADGVLSQGLTEGLYRDLKTKLAAWGTTQTPLLDKAWRESRNS